MSDILKDVLDSEINKIRNDYSCKIEFLNNAIQNEQEKFSKELERITKDRDTAIDALLEEVMAGASVLKELETAAFDKYLNAINQAK